MKNAIIHVWCVLSLLLLLLDLTCASELAAHAPRRVNADRSAAAAYVYRRVCDVTQYNNSLQDAINACCTAGTASQRAQVLVPAGTRLSPTGPISANKCSHLEVALAQDSVVPALPVSAWSGAPQWLQFYACSDIVLHGPGRIDGQGELTWPLQTDGRCHSRPKGLPVLVAFRRCDDVTVENVTLWHSPGFHLFLNGSHFVVRGVTIDAGHVDCNLDCIDVAADTVYIGNCSLTCGDDNIAIKTGSRNIYIENIQMYMGHGVSVGGLEYGEVNNITARHVTGKGTCIGARIKTQASSTATATNIAFADFALDGVRSPIVLDIQYDNGKGDGGVVSNVYFTRFTAINTPAKNATNLYADNKRLSRVRCTAAHQCTQIHFENLQLDAGFSQCAYVYGTNLAPLTPANVSTCVQSDGSVPVPLPDRWNLPAMLT